MELTIHHGDEGLAYRVCYVACYIIGVCEEETGAGTMVKKEPSRLTPTISYSSAKPHVQETPQPPKQYHKLVIILSYYITYANSQIGMQRVPISPSRKEWNKCRKEQQELMGEKTTSKVDTF